MKAQSNIKQFFKNNNGKFLIKNVIKNIQVDNSSKKRPASEIAVDNKDKDIEKASTPNKRTKNESTPKKSANKQGKDNIEEEKSEVQSNIATTSQSKSTIDTSSNIASIKPLQNNSLNTDPLASYESFVSRLGDWQEPLKDFLEKNNKLFRGTYEFVKKEYQTNKVYPPRHLIFNAFNHVPFDKLKVVIVGQDPYIKEGEAMGLSFSVPKNIKVPPSLKNIYKALEADPKVDFKPPNPIHGDLTRWADQGVLLLNAILTVKAGASNSHQKKGWEQFTDNVIQAINKKQENVVFMLWGKKAIEKVQSVDTKKHLILQGVHPSPLAGQGFKSCTHFSQANEYLKQNEKPEIDWNLN